MAETILIVDDEAASRDLLEAILTGAGYRVEQVAGGAAALTQATRRPPDLILLDLMMAGVNGLEVCQRLKRDPGTAGVPVIVVTAFGQVKTKEEALTSGADDFVAKPIRPEDLLVRVRAMLKVRHIRQDLDRSLAYLYELEAARHAQRQESSASLGAGRPPSPPPPVSAPPILLVDDEALIREYYAELLTGHGFQVVVASGGAEALEQVQQHPIEAVILDIMMPGMSGLEVLGRLQARDPDLPVIMLTADASSQNAITALKLGAFDFIVKGLQRDLVVLALHRAIRHRREILGQRRKIEQLEARIAELGGGRQDG